MIFEKKCQKCREVTIHRIIKVHILKGAKLICLKCLYKSNRYYNVKHFENKVRCNAAQHLSKDKPICIAAKQTNNKSLLKGGKRI